MTKKPSLLIIGNSNVGKSSITKLLLPHPKLYKGKTGKNPGSTLLIKPLDLQDMPYNIVDLPGFGYMRKSSKRREEHVKQQIVLHIEKHHEEYFLGLVVINVLRIEDELEKYFVKNKNTIPLSFELIQFLQEFSIPLLVLLNKIDKISTFDIKRIKKSLVNKASRYGLELVSLQEDPLTTSGIPYLTFSALKKTNLSLLKKFISQSLES